VHGCWQVAPSLAVSTHAIRFDALQVEGSWLQAAQVGLRLEHLPLCAPTVLVSTLQAGKQLRQVRLRRNCGSLHEARFKPQVGADGSQCEALMSGVPVVAQAQTKHGGGETAAIGEQKCSASELL
jgi:hypothetical protein